MKEIVDAIVIETYYHLILMQKPLFSMAIDQVYKFEQVHLKQREIISGRIPCRFADAAALAQQSSTGSVENQPDRGELAFDSSASVPYDKIVHTTLASLTEKPLDSFRITCSAGLRGSEGHRPA